MDNNKECAVIKDLIPLYKDDALSELSVEAVREHIEKCDSCRQYKEYIFNDSQKSELNNNNTPEVEKVETQEYTKIAKRLKKRRIRNALIAVFSTVSVIILFSYMFIFFKVPSESMKPTIEIDDICFINKMAYNFSKPEEGDLVYISGEQINFEFNDVVRIIGTPGDKILIDDGVLYVNGQGKYEDSYSYIESAGIAKTEFLVPDGKYFVMGDNVTNSYDSRNENYGCVDRKKILGKVCFSW